MAVHQVRVLTQIVRRTVKDDVAVVEHVAAVREAERSLDILFDDDNRLPGFRDSSTNADQVLHYDRCKPFEWLVKQDHLWLAHERARNRQNLLLAARQFASAVVLALGKTREHLVSTLERPRLFRGQF